MVPTVGISIGELAREPPREAARSHDLPHLTATVTTFAQDDGGIEVQIAGTEFQTFIKRSELARDRNDQRSERFAVGEKVDARVIQFDKKARKVQVSIKALEVAEEKEAIAQYGSSDSGATLGDILGTALKNREKNLTSKIALIQEAEALSDSIEWQETTDKLKDLRSTWIKTGPVEKDLTEEIEERFRTAVEHFFERKKNFFEDKKKMQNRIYDRYRDLISQSVALQNSEYRTLAGRGEELRDVFTELGGLASTFADREAAAQDRDRAAEDRARAAEDREVASVDRSRAAGAGAGR